MSASNQKKILVLLGSPRKKGNSTLLANRIIKGAEGAGAAVETVYLHGLDIAPCRACEGCRKKDARDCVDAFNSGCVNALRTFQDAFGYVGMKLEGMVYGSASDRGEIEGDTDLMNRATRLGQQLAE